MLIHFSRNAIVLSILAWMANYFTSNFLFFGFSFKSWAEFWISAVNVKYRDFRYFIPFVIQLGLYISPVGFSSNVIPKNGDFYIH